MYSNDGSYYTGHTDLAQMTFPKHKYVSLEDHDIRSLAINDPRQFLNDYPTKQGIILDEIQHAPNLLSYIQTIVATATAAAALTLSFRTELKSKINSVNVNGFVI